MPVYIARQNTYDAKEIARSIRLGIDSMGFNLSGKKTAVIKINVVQAKTPEGGIITHPAVTEAVIDVLRDAGVADITLLEAPALGVDVKEAFKVSGYQELAKRKGVKLVNGFDAPRIKLETGLGYENLPNVYDDADLPKWFTGCMTVPSICVEADLYVSIPKLKTHNRTMVSLSLKNQWGLLSFKERQDYHRVGLHDPIAYLARGVRPDLVVVDGVLGLEGNGPILGVPKQSGVVLVGNDALETDIVGTQVMGHDPSKVLHFQKAVELGVGTWQTKVLGTPVEDVAIDFAPAPLDLKKNKNFYLWRNHRACHLDDDAFVEAFKLAKKNPKYWMFFVKLGYYVLFRRLDVVRGRGMRIPDVGTKGRIILSGECSREILDGYEEVPPNVIHIPGCPPKPEDIVKAIIRM